MIDSTIPEEEEFYALGKKVLDFHGFDTFQTPKNVMYVSYISDEVTSICPVTKQPDFYVVEISLDSPSRCLESKSLKLFLQSLRDRGSFCEALASDIAEIVSSVTGSRSVTVDVTQKARGGISISARAEVSSGGKIS